MSYTRVIPRDLFNEAKLLKCLGQLALLIHDGVKVPKGLTLDHEDPESGFQIDQDSASGELYCSALELTYKANPQSPYAGRLIGLRAPYNSKDPYPLRFTIWEGDEGPVFDDKGGLSDEFRTFLSGLE